MQVQLIMIYANLDAMSIYLSECVSCSFFDALCEGGRREGGRRSVRVVMMLLSEGRSEGSH